MLKQGSMRVLGGTMAEYTVVEYAGIQFHRKRRRDSDCETVHQYQRPAGSARHDRASEHCDFIASVFRQQAQWVRGQGATPERLCQQLLFSLESLVVEASPASDAVGQC